MYRQDLIFEVVSRDYKMAQRPPIRVEALKSDAANPATFIFLHGYGDDAEGFVSMYNFFNEMLLNLK